MNSMTSEPWQYALQGGKNVSIRKQNKRDDLNVSANMAQKKDFWVGQLFPLPQPAMKHDINK